MNRSTILSRTRRFLLAGLFAVTCWAGFTGSASANPPEGYCYQYVTRHEYRQVAYTCYETRYDHCYRPYTVEVVRYRTVCVPIRVRVCVPCEPHCPPQYGY